MSKTPIAVGALVGRRQRALVDARRRERRAAERHVDQFAIGARMDAAGAFAERHGGERLHLHRVDDREIAGAFVADVDPVAVLAGADLLPHPAVKSAHDGAHCQQRRFQIHERLIGK